MAKAEKNTDMSTNNNSEKLKALKLTMDKIEKDYGKGSVMMMNEKGEAGKEVSFHRFHRAGCGVGYWRFTKRKGG